MRPGFDLVWSEYSSSSTTGVNSSRPRQTGPGARFTKGFSIAIQIRWKFLFHSHLDFNTVIATNFCTWHDSCAVVAYAKFCCELMTNNIITARRRFHRIWIAGNKPLLKQVPALVPIPPRPPIPTPDQSVHPCPYRSLKNTSFSPILNENKHTFFNRNRWLWGPIQHPFSAANPDYLFIVLDKVSFVWKRELLYQTHFSMYIVSQVRSTYPTDQLYALTKWKEADECNIFVPF